MHGQQNMKKNILLCLLRVLLVGLVKENKLIKRLTPNDPYMGRTAPLTSKRCILYIY